MKYSIVYSSQTGNTQLLAETIKNTLPSSDCVYYGLPNDNALNADRIYVGFWTNQGTSDEKATEFLQKLTTQEVFLFGTAGFGIDQAYFEKVIKESTKNISKDAKVIGHFMCQGKMQMSVRERYVKIQNSDKNTPNIQGLIDNFDEALKHPNKEDLDSLKKIIKSI